jgi:predicted nucleic acid-binding protein
MVFVIDASIVAAFAFEEAAGPRVALAMGSLETSQALAPNLFFFEIRNLLVVNERRGRTTPARSDSFLRVLARLPIRLAPTPENNDVVGLARERKLTVYDAAYLELAKREGLPLATLDRALERAAIAEGVALFGA